ncbi:AbgT family transporter [Campylobacter sp.]|uniref:AbgT family transporter n=1 Tax=Campylobacter sp. TaxID=205 RepID=UPI0026DD735B|nr:AbgT family transporter [Campylobacter sp.]MDO4674853.1 AbgT family transporter [Campylobacter sp.]
MILNKIEKIGNKIPNVSVLFLFALLIVLLASWVLSCFDFDYFLLKNDGTKEQIVIKNFLTLPHFLEFLSKMTSNFISFPPLALTIVITLGIGIAEESGFLRVSLIKFSQFVPKNFVVPVVLILSILCHLIGDGAYVFLMPIAALLFLAAKRHPVAGIATAFAGLAGGFCAGFTPSIIDPIMQIFTEKSAHIIDDSYSVHVLCNYFLSLGSVVGVVLFCWWVTSRVVEPYCQKNLPLACHLSDIQNRLSPCENRAFYWAFLSVLMLFVGIFGLSFGDFLRGPGGSLTEKDSLLMKNLVPFLFLFFALPGLIFGYKIKRFHSLNDVFLAATKSLEPLLGFVVFCFICGQFLFVFNDSNISKLLSLSGASILSSLQMPQGLTILALLIFTAFLNLFITSATSKWAVLAPVFVPMLMLVGLSPELVQATFRVSDSAINVMTPLFPFYPLIISFCQKYYPKTGVGTLCALMLPYSIALMIALSATLYLFWILEIPLGFESFYYYRS